jgi:sulfate permease, SulP family
MNARNSSSIAVDPGYRSWRANLVPGALAALLTLPQAIALSALAGMPFEAGLYLSLLPALVATVLGHSPLALSGANTAASLVLFASASALAAPGSPDYIQQVLAITLFAGLFQLLLAALRAGNLLLELPASVTRGLIAGTGVLILGQQIGPLLGVPVNGISVIETLGQALYFDAPLAGPLMIGGISVAAGIAARLLGWQRYALLVGLMAGWLCAEVADLLTGAANTGIERLGTIPLGSHFFSWPTIDLTDTTRLVAAIRDGFAVAVVGALQTAVMARILSFRTNSAMYINRDIAAQALMNLLAAFNSAYAGATSFNRTLAHLEAGATGRSAGVFCILFLALGVLLAGPLLARIPLPAVSGVLVLVGWAMVMGIRRDDFANRVHAIELLVTIGIAVFIGLLQAVIAGAFLAAYFRALRHKDGAIPHQGNPPSHGSGR